MVERLDILWNNANKNLLSETTQNEFKEKIRKFLKGESSQSDFISELKLSKEILEDDIEDGKQPDESFNLFKKTMKQLMDEVLDDSAEPYLKIEADAWKNLTNKKKRKFNKREIQDGINKKNLEFVRGITLSNIAKDDDVIERLTGTLQMEDLSGIEEGFAQSNEANQFIGPDFGYDYYMEMNAKIRKPMRPEEPYFLTYAVGNNNLLKESHVDIYWPVLDINEQIELRAKYVADRLGIPALPTIKKGKQLVSQENISKFKIPLDKKIIKEMSKKLEPLEEKHGATFRIVSPSSLGEKEKKRIRTIQDKGATQYDRKDHINPEVHKSAEEAVREVLKTIVGKGFDEPLKQLDAIYQYVIQVKLFDTERADKDLTQRVADTYPTLDGLTIVNVEGLSEAEKKKLKKPKYPNREYKADFYSIPNWYVLKENTNEIEGVKSTRGYLNAENPNAEIYYVEDKKTYEDNKELFDESWERMKQEAIKKYSNEDFSIGAIPDVYRRVFIQKEKRKLTPQEAKGLKNYKLLTEKYDEVAGKSYFISSEKREKEGLKGGKYGYKPFFSGTDSQLSNKERVLAYVRVLGNSPQLSERAKERLGLVDELINNKDAFITATESNLIFPVDYEIPRKKRTLPIEKASKDEKISISNWLNLLRGDILISYETQKLNLSDSSKWYLVSDRVQGEVVGTKTTRTKERVEGEKGRMEQETVSALANEFKKGLKGIAKIQLHTLAEIEYNPNKTRGVNKAMKNHINTILNKVQDILDEVEE